MSRISTSFAIALAMVGGVAFAADAQSPTALMKLVEETVTLPMGAVPIAQYDRYYTFMGDRTVIGIYVRTDLHGDAHPGERHWVSQKEMPQISGGGCSVVTVFYDPKTLKTDSMCNFAQ